MKVKWYEVYQSTEKEGSQSIANFSTFKQAVAFRKEKLKELKANGTNTDYKTGGINIGIDYWQGYKDAQSGEIWDSELIDDVTPDD